jgi:hypothetical protein
MCFEISYSEVTLDQPKRHCSLQTDFRQTENTCERMCRVNVFRDHHQQRNNKEGNKGRLQICSTCLLMLDQIRSDQIRSACLLMLPLPPSSPCLLSPSHSVMLIVAYVYLTICWLSPFPSSYSSILAVSELQEVRLLTISSFPSRCTCTCILSIERSPLVSYVNLDFVLSYMSIEILFFMSDPLI